MKIAFRAALLAALLAVAAFSSPSKVDAQGYPGACIYPFASNQPAVSCDYSNPPLTFGRQGGASFAEVIPIGSVAYGSLGNATTYVSGTVYVAAIPVPADFTATNISCLNGGTVGTNSVIYSLYNSAGIGIDGTVSTGTATAGANAFQTIAMTKTIALVGPSTYYVAVQANGATDNIRTIAASTFVGVRTQSSTGVFGTLPNITPPTTFTANVGPICYLN